MRLQARLTMLEARNAPARGPDFIVVRSVVSVNGTSRPAYAFFVGYQNEQLRAFDGETEEEFSARCHHRLESLKQIQHASSENRAKEHFGDNRQRNDQTEKLDGP